MYRFEGWLQNCVLVYRSIIIASQTPYCTIPLPCHIWLAHSWAPHFSRSYAVSGFLFSSLLGHFGHRSPHLHLFGMLNYAAPTQATSTSRRGFPCIQYTHY